MRNESLVRSLPSDLEDGLESLGFRQHTLNEIGGFASLGLPRKALISTLNGLFLEELGYRDPNLDIFESFNRWMEEEYNPSVTGVLGYYATLFNIMVNEAISSVGDKFGNVGAAIIDKMDDTDDGEYVLGMSVNEYFFITCASLFLAFVCVGSVLFAFVFGVDTPNGTVVIRF